MHVNRPDVIINCAGMTDVTECENNIDEAYRVNAIGIRNVALAANEINAKVICHFIDNEEYGLYHIVCPGSCSRYEFAYTILEMAGLSGCIKLHPVDIGDNARPTYSVLDNMMLRLTGIEEPKDWKTALKEYLDETAGRA